MMVLVRPLGFVIPLSLSMDKIRSTTKVESQTFTIDQQASKVTTTILKTPWSLLPLRVLPMELKLKETWIGSRGNGASLLNQMKVAEGGDTDAIRVGAVVEAAAKLQPPQLLRPEQQAWLLLNMKRESNVKEKRRKNADVSMEMTDLLTDLLTMFQVKKPLNGHRMAKIRMLSSNINRTARHLLVIQSRDNRLLIILPHPAKSILVSRLPPSASSILTTVTHRRRAIRLPCPTPILLLPERLDTLRNLGNPGGLMRM